MPTQLPTNAPTNAPSESPSVSPTSHPITYSDFNSSLYAFFRITGWTDSQISDVNGNIDTFVSSLTTYIHEGFDNDGNLKYSDIVPNISTINDRVYDYFIIEDSSETSSILKESINGGMRLQYLVECSHDNYCEYISDDSSTIGMDRAVFESFISAKLNSYFVSTEATNDAVDSSLIFSVENFTTISYDAMENSSNDDDGSSIFATILFIFGALCLFISGISIGVILHNRKRQSSIAAVKNDSNVVSHSSVSQKPEVGQGNNGSALEMSPAATEKTKGHETRYSISCNEGQVEGMTATGFVSPGNEREMTGQNGNLESINVSENVVESDENPGHIMGDAESDDSMDIAMPGNTTAE